MKIIRIRKDNTRLVSVTILVLMEVSPLESVQQSGSSWGVKRRVSGTFFINGIRRLSRRCRHSMACLSCKGLNWCNERMKLIKTFAI